MIQLCSLESVFAGKEKNWPTILRGVCAALTKQQVTHTAGPARVKAMPPLPCEGKG